MNPAEQLIGETTREDARELLRRLYEWLVLNYGADAAERALPVGGLEGIEALCAAVASGKEADSGRCPGWASRREPAEQGEPTPESKARQRGAEGPSCYTLPSGTVVELQPKTGRNLRQAGKVLESLGFDLDTCDPLLFEFALATTRARVQGQPLSIEQIETMSTTDALQLVQAMHGKVAPDEEADSARCSGVSIAPQSAEQGEPHPESEARQQGAERLRAAFDALAEVHAKTKAMLDSRGAFDLKSLYEAGRDLVADTERLTALSLAVVETVDPSGAPRRQGRVKGGAL